MKTIEVTLVAEVEKVFSENTYLKPGRRHLYVPSSVKEYKKSLVEQFKSQLEGRELPKDVKGATVQMVFLISPRRFSTADTTNMVKLVEDSLVEAIGVDDSFHIHVQALKIPRSQQYEKDLIIVSIKYLQEDRGEAE